MLKFIFKDEWLHPVKSGGKSSFLISSGVLKKDTNSLKNIQIHDWNAAQLVKQSLGGLILTYI